MNAPVRLRLSRAKGFDLQAHSRAVNGLPAIVVARPGKWGNPFVVGRDGTAAECVRLYALSLCGFFALTGRPSVDEQHASMTTFCCHHRELRGHNLACWCSDGQPCHADVLIENVALLEESA